MQKGIIDRFRSLPMSRAAVVAGRTASDVVYNVLTLIIMAATGLERLLITLGQDGMALFEKGKATYRIATRARQVFDVSGAGDTVLSVLGLALAAGAAAALEYVSGSESTPIDLTLLPGEMARRWRARFTASSMATR